MRVRAQQIGDGLHPSEIVIEIHTVGGSERLVIDRHSLQENSIFVGLRPLAEKKGQLLVELPRETMSGTWRVWVKPNEIVPESQESVGAA